MSTGAQKNTTTPSSRYIPPDQRLLKTLYQTYGACHYTVVVVVQTHLRSALRLREMCSRNGGLFIKVGQHIGALEYMLPKEYVRTFQLFHSEAPQTPLPRLIQVVEEELGRPCMSKQHALSLLIDDNWL